MNNKKISQSVRAEEQHRKMLEGSIVGVLLALSFPEIITGLIDSFYNLADTYFVSRLGELATAAVSINDALMHIIRGIAFGFGVGASSYISRLLGAKRNEEAFRTATTSLFTSAIVMAVLAAVALIFLKPLTLALGSTQESLKFAMDYGRWTLVFSPITVFTIALTQILRSEGNTKRTMFGQVAGCIVNLALDPLFIYVIGWGVTGAAIATGLSRVVTGVILMAPIVRKQTVLVIDRKHFAPSMKMYGEIARMGIPSALRNALIGVSGAFINNLAADFGNEVLAAVAVANKCMKMVAAGILGFGRGMQPIIGYCWGAGNFKRTRKVFGTVMLLGCSIAALFGAVLWLLSPAVLKAFSAGGDMLSCGNVLIRSQCISMVCHIAVILINNLFQSTGKALRAGILGMLRQVFSLIPCALIMTAIWGIDGLVRSQAAADWFSFLIASVMLFPLLREMKQRGKECDSMRGEAREI